MARATEEEKAEVSKRVLQAIANTESTIDLLRESYDVAACSGAFIERVKKFG